MSTADELRTEAGRLLIRAYAKSGLPIRPDEVRAIEAEAARQTEPRLDVELIRKALAIGSISWHGDGWYASEEGYDYDDAEATLHAAHEALAVYEAAASEEEQ